MYLLELIVAAWLIVVGMFFPLLILGSWIADQLERIQRPGARL